MAGLSGRWYDLNSWKVNTAAADSVTTVFALTDTPLAIAFLIVKVNGVEKVPLVDYTLAGKNVTFISGAPVTDSTIIFRYVRNEL